MPPPKFTEEEHERLRQLIHVADDIGHRNQEDGIARRKPKFDGTYNLGHLLTSFTILITMGTAIGTMYVNNKVTTADHETRIHALEFSQAKMQATEEKLSDAVAQGMVNQKEISIALKYLSDKKP